MTMKEKYNNSLSKLLM